jgi:hypothetical protein
MHGIDILLFSKKIFIKTVPAVDGVVTFLETDLTLAVEARSGSSIVTSTATATIATATSSWRSTAATTATPTEATTSS